jgi:hypothetical protein
MEDVDTCVPMEAPSAQSTTVTPNLLSALGVLEDNHFAFDNLPDREDNDGWSVLTAWLDLNTHELTALRNFRATKDGTAARASKGDNPSLEVNNTSDPPTTDLNDSLAQLSESVSAGDLTGSTATAAGDASQTTTLGNGTIQRLREPSLAQGIRESVYIRC